jgi:hypothetical protein
MIVATHSPAGVITTEITLKNAQTLVVTTEGVSTASLPAFQIETKEAALRGPPGPSGGAISSDANNRLKLGTDSKLYVADDFIPNPLAYYYLERGNF